MFDKNRYGGAAVNSISRETLEKSRLFLNQAQQAVITGERFKFIANLEAAIVFGRTVTFHIQKEYTHQTKFEDWYGSHEQAMKTDPLMRFMLENRNYVLKEGQVEVIRLISLNISVKFASFTGGIEVDVIRGTPWYRRSPKIIWEDIRTTVNQFLRINKLNWLQNRTVAQKPPKTPENTKSISNKSNYFFSDTRWQERPALELVSDYLDKLEIIVDDAESVFKKPLDKDAEHIT